MDDETIRHVLLVELHSLIAGAATVAVAKLGVQQEPDEAGALSSEKNPPLASTVRGFVAYPPGDGSGPILSEEEQRALGELKLSSAARSALSKVFADASASVIFRFLALIDGVGDPEVVPVDGWVGASLGVPIRDDHDMLHDAFYETYWAYVKAVTK